MWILIISLVLLGVIALIAGIIRNKRLQKKIEKGELDRMPEVKEVDVEYGKYKKIAERIDNIYSQYASKEPHETNKMEKMMTWYGINMKTMNDQSNSKISELLMQGTNMGIIEGRRLLNNNPSVDNEVKNILNDFVVMQEDSVETLKKYL